MKNERKLTTWKNIVITANANCPTMGGIKWLIVSSERPVAKKLMNELGKTGFSVCLTGTTMSTWITDADRKKLFLSILGNQKTNKFNVVEIYDRQFGLAQNVYNNNYPYGLVPDTGFVTEDCDFKTFWPVTSKQLGEMIVVDNRML